MLSIFVISIGIVIGTDDSWLYHLWRNKSSSLIEAYKNKGYGIVFIVQIISPQLLL